MALLVADCGLVWRCGCVGTQFVFTGKLMLFDFFASSIGAQVSYTVLALSHFVYVVDRAMAYMLTQRGVKPSDNRRYILYSVADFCK